jgi:hypothetical protein
VSVMLPPGATAIKAPGFSRTEDRLVWQHKLTRDRVLKISWRP